MKNDAAIRGGATSATPSDFTDAAMRLADAIEAESAALAELDVGLAAVLSKTKARAAQRFMDARGALPRDVAGLVPEDAALALQRLTDAVGRNRALLARAVAAQKALIEVIVQPMRSQPAGYGQGPMPQQQAVAFARSA